MKGLLAFGAMMAVILLGLGLWTATPQGGGGLGAEGGAGQDVEDPGRVGNGVVPAERDGVAQDDSEGRVEIRDGRLVRSTVEVPPESVVTFLNRDDAARRINFDDRRLPDAEIPASGAHTVEVPATGRFAFEISGDGEAMDTGTIVVSGG